MKPSAGRGSGAAREAKPADGVRAESASLQDRPESADLYEVLEVSPRASLEVIQAAYRALVRANHPDLTANPKAHRRMKLVNAAYAVLKDPEQRAHYDLARLRSARQRASAAAVQYSSAPAAVYGRTPMIKASGRAPKERPFLPASQPVLLLLLAASLLTIVLVLVWLVDASA